MVVASSCTKHFCTRLATGTSDKNVPCLCPNQHKFSGKKRAIPPRVQAADHDSGDDAPAHPDSSAPTAKKRRKKEGHQGRLFTEKGMFLLKDPNMNLDNIFPHNMANSAMPRIYLQGTSVSQPYIQVYRQILVHAW